MDDEKQGVPHFDPPPYSKVTASSLEGPGTNSNVPDNQLPCHQNQLGGYSHEPGYQPAPDARGFSPQSCYQATPQNEYPVKGNQVLSPQIVVNEPGERPSVPFVVVTQQRPPDYLCASILACICCFWPIGIFAIYYSCRANTLANNGQVRDAMSMSKVARSLILVSVLLGIIFSIIFVMFNLGVRKF